MNETRSTHRRGRISGRLAVVLCLLLVVAVLPLAAASATPATLTDAQAAYINSATITLTPACSYRLDGGPVMDATTAVTTSVYGSHVLSLNTTWKDYPTGTTQTVMTIPFYVDDDVLPAITCDAAASYVTTSPVTMTLTATDNFNGSDIDSVYYRIDGGNLVQVVSNASNAATQLLISRLPQVVAAKLVAVDPNSALPTPHLGGAATPDQCVNCHDIIGTTPEPTSTPEPTGTPVPHGLRKVVTVTGLGTHTIEYWAADIARNASAHVTKTFTITAPVVPVVPVVPAATTLTIKSNHASTYRSHTIVLSGSLKPGVPLNSNVLLQYKKPGTTPWVTLSTRHTSSTGAWSYSYKVTKKGSYYFRAVYLGTSAFMPKTSSWIRVSVK